MLGIRISGVIIHTSFSYTTILIDGIRIGPTVAIGSRFVISWIVVVVASYIPAWVGKIHGIVEAIRIPVGPDAWLGDFEPVWLDEHGQFGVVVAGVEVLQAGSRVVAFADEALVLAGRRQVEGPFLLFGPKGR